MIEIPILNTGIVENMGSKAFAVVAVVIVIIMVLSIIKEGGKGKRKRKKMTVEERKQRWLEKQEWREEFREKKLREKEVKYINNYREKRNRERIQKTFKDIRKNI